MTRDMTRVVVFGYHEVGARCLRVLLDARQSLGLEIPLVVTHQDDPNETVFFSSVSALAQQHGLNVITPANANDPALLAQLQSLQPDFIFSFYYRHMLQPALLATARRGAWNMHGSLLPKYRGRAPVNWAVLHGERETGVSLHQMVAKPDAGDLLGQQSVAIGPDDTAAEVMDRVSIAAEELFQRLLPELVAGRLQPKPLDLSQGSYFGGRRPEDGRIHWQQPAAAIHNLVRAVAPPYPGAFCDVNGMRLRILRTRLTPNTDLASPREIPAPSPAQTHPPCLWRHNGALYARCGDATDLQLLAFELQSADGQVQACDIDGLQKHFGPMPILLDTLHPQCSSS